MNELKKNLSNELVLFAANQVFAVELCCPQRIRFSLPNCVVRSESVFSVEFVLSTVHQGFAAELVWSATNQGFAAELMLSGANQGFAAELCCPQ
jgi:hypothetical protein